MPNDHLRGTSIKVRNGRDMLVCLLTMFGFTRDVEMHSCITFAPSFASQRERAVFPPDRRISREIEENGEREREEDREKKRGRKRGRGRSRSGSRD